MYNMVLLKYAKTGNKKTCNLFCNIAAKRVTKRRCAFYHPHQTCLAPNQVVDRFDVGGKTCNIASFFSNVPKQVACFLLPVFPYLKLPVICVTIAFSENDTVVFQTISKLSAGQKPAFT